jgi:uncharacterized protein YqeY
MSLEEKINDGIKTAMKAKNEADLRSYRAIKAAIMLAKTAPDYKGSLTGADEAKLLQKLAKQRKDSLDIYRQQNREDLARIEEEELAVIEGFLPAKLSEEELRTELKAIIASTGASSPADMGKVMGVASRQLAGRADGKAIAALVKEMLQR